jgi:hypothetical protein
VEDALYNGRNLRMKKLIIYAMIAVLGLIILGVASIFFSIVGYNRQADIVFAAATLCLSVALPGAIIAPTKGLVVFFMGLLVASVAILILDIALLIHLEIQDVNYGHAIPIFELFLVWLLGILIGAMIYRFRRHISYLTTAAIGIVAVCIGIYFMLRLDYHERAYIALGTGCICLLVGVAGMWMSQKKPHQIKF